MNNIGSDGKCNMTNIEGLKARLEAFMAREAGSASLTFFQDLLNRSQKSSTHQIEVIQLKFVDL